MKSAAARRSWGQPSATSSTFRCRCWNAPHNVLSLEVAKSLTAVNITSATIKHDFSPLENALVTVLKNELEMISLLPPWTFNENIFQAFCSLHPYKFILVRSSHVAGSRSEIWEWKWKNQVLTICQRKSVWGRRYKAKWGAQDREVQVASTAPFSVLPLFIYWEAEQMRVMTSLIPLPCLGFAATNRPPNHKSIWCLEIGVGRSKTHANWFDLGHTKKSDCLWRPHRSHILALNKAFPSGQRHHTN